MLAPAQLNIVCFRYRARGADKLNAEIVADLHESGIAAPSTTQVNGRLAIRAAFVNHRTQFCDVDGLVDAVLHFGDAHAKRRDRMEEPWKKDEPCNVYGVTDLPTPSAP